MVIGRGGCAFCVDVCDLVVNKPQSAGNAGKGCKGRDSGEGMRAGDRGQEGGYFPFGTALGTGELCGHTHSMA